MDEGKSSESVCIVFFSSSDFSLAMLAIILFSEKIFALSCVQSFNQLDLPAYETYDKLRKMLLLAISECSEGFGLA